MKQKSNTKNGIFDCERQKRWMAAGVTLGGIWDERLNNVSLNINVIA